MQFKTEIANELSDELLSEAARWVSKHLLDANWMRANRTLSQEWERAEWVLLGCNKLTIAEMRALRDRIQPAGWACVLVRPAFHNTTTNWELFVSHDQGAR